MNHTITTSLNDKLFNFVNSEAKAKNITKKSIIEKWLMYYRKYEMESKIKTGLKSRKKEYKKINSDFSCAQFNSIKD